MKNSENLSNVPQGIFVKLRRPLDNNALPEINRDFLETLSLKVIAARNQNLRDSFPWTVPPALYSRYCYYGGDIFQQVQISSSSHDSSVFEKDKIRLLTNPLLIIYQLFILFFIVFKYFLNMILNLLTSSQMLLTLFIHTLKTRVHMSYIMMFPLISTTLQNLINLTRLFILTIYYPNMLSTLILCPINKIIQIL